MIEEHPMKILLDKYFFSIKKAFGMYSQVNFDVQDVTRKIITLEVKVTECANPWADYSTIPPREVVYDVRNAMLSQLGDLLPIPVFKAFYKNTVTDVQEEFQGQFYNPAQDEFLLQSSAIPVRDVVLKSREYYRPVFNICWSILPPYNEGETR